MDCQGHELLLQLNGQVQSHGFATSSFLLLLVRHFVTSSLLREPTKNLFDVDPPGSGVARAPGAPAAPSVGAGQLEWAELFTLKSERIKNTDGFI